MSVGSKTVSAGPRYNSMWPNVVVAIAVLAIGIGAGLLIGRVTSPDTITAAETELRVEAMPVPQAAGAPFVDYALRAGPVEIGEDLTVASDRLIDYALRHSSAQATAVSNADLGPLDDYALRHSGDAASAHGDNSAPGKLSDYALRHAE